MAGGGAELRAVGLAGPSGSTPRLCLILRPPRRVRNRICSNRSWRSPTWRLARG